MFPKYEYKACMAYVQNSRTFMYPLKYMSDLTEVVIYSQNDYISLLTDEKMHVIIAKYIVNCLLRISSD